VGHCSVGDAGRDILASKSIRIKPLAPNTQGQNGGAKRLRGVLKNKKRAMRVGA
jgi:hypothetical protein